MDIADSVHLKFCLMFILVYFIVSLISVDSPVEVPLHSMLMQ